MAKLIFIGIIKSFKTKAKNNSKDDFFKLFNISIFENTIENFRTLRVIKLVTKERRSNYLVLEPNKSTTK